jgi:hypothetical protein
MNDELKKLKDAFAQTRLTEAEKASMRAEISRFADAHPLRTAHGFSAPSPSRFLYISAWNYRVPAALAVFLLVGGTASAAQASLPGDALYPMKIHVNEQVEAALALSSEAKAEVEARLATRRLDEAQELAVEGKLTPQANAEITERFAAHADALDKHLAKLSERGNFSAVAKVNGEVEDALDARFETLESLAQGAGISTTSRPALGGILDFVSKRHKKAAENRIDAEVRQVRASGEVGAKASAFAAYDQTRKNLEQVRAFIDAQSASLSVSVRSDADKELLQASQTITQGKAQLDAGAYADAFASFKEAARRAAEAKRLFTTGVHGLGLTASSSARATGTEISQPKKDENGEATDTRSHDDSNPGSSEKSRGGILKRVEQLFNKADDSSDHASGSASAAESVHESQSAHFRIGR